MGLRKIPVSLEIEDSVAERSSKGAPKPPTTFFPNLALPVMGSNPSPNASAAWLQGKASLEVSTLTPYPEPCRQTATRTRIIA